jgi:hypothetical protein
LLQRTERLEKLVQWRKLARLRKQQVKVRGCQDKYMR